MVGKSSAKGSTTIWLGFFTVAVVVVALMFAMILFSPGNFADAEPDSTPTPKVVTVTVTPEPSGDQGNTPGRGSPPTPTETETDESRNTSPTPSSTPTPELTTTTSTPEPEDSDNDGLSDEEENRLGTDPYSADTDKDGLLDGWEVHGVRFPDRCDSAIPLDEYGADPLHKDLFFELRHSGMGITDTEYTNLRTQFYQAPVSNPDGERGINLYLDADRGFADLEGETTGFNEDFEDSCRFGVFYFGTVGGHDRDVPSAKASGYRSYYSLNLAENSRDHPDNYLYKTYMHEIGHNILGELDEENQGEDAFHGKYCGWKKVSENTREKPQGGIMCPSSEGRTFNDNIWKEIERDGLLGLPEAEDWELAK